MKNIKPTGISSWGKDKSMLKDIAASGKSDLLLRRFALKLLRRFEHHQDVKHFFHDLWDKSSEYELSRKSYGAF